MDVDNFTKKSIYQNDAFWIIIDLNYQKTGKVLFQEHSQR